MDNKAMDAGLRLLRTRRDLEPTQQELWLYYFMVVNPNRGAAKHAVTREEVNELVRAFNAREVK